MNHVLLEEVDSGFTRQRAWLFSERSFTLSELYLGRHESTNASTMGAVAHTDSDNAPLKALKAPCHESGYLLDAK